MEIIQHLSDLVNRKRFSLILNGINVCDLSFDEFGKHTIGLTNVDDVHKFCRVALAVIDDLPTGESLVGGAAGEFEIARYTLIEVLTTERATRDRAFGHDLLPTLRFGRMSL